MVVFSKVVSAAVGLAAVASAVPTSNPRQGFTLDQILSPKSSSQGINFPKMYGKTLAKYGSPIPDKLREAEGHGTAVTTPLEYDIMYLTPVDVGGTKMNLDIDTGSADLWVFSDKLPAEQQKGHSVYKPSDHSQKLDGYSWEISYGDGSSASGDVYKDTVTLGGITAQSQAVEAASKISDQFAQDEHNDGLLGLSFSSINTVEPKSQTTFVDTVKSQLDTPVFAAALKYHQPGSYDFGFIDHDKYQGELSYVDVDKSQGFWMFSAEASGIKFDAIADTGTTLIMIDPLVVIQYYLQVPGAIDNLLVGGWTFPCDSDLPDFTIDINGYKAVIPGKHINYAPVTDGSDTCLGGIQDNLGMQFSILGDIFLKSQYVVFDYEGPRLGFAPQA